MNGRALPGLSHEMSSIVEKNMLFMAIISSRLRRSFASTALLVGFQELANFPMVIQGCGLAQDSFCKICGLLKPAEVIEFLDGVDNLLNMLLVGTFYNRSDMLVDLGAVLINSLFN